MPQPSANSKRVFLCHSWGDKERVRKLSHQLRADGLEPWLDEEDLLPGQIWETEIRNAVKASAAVLVFLSKTSVSSSGFVHKEIKIALDVAEEQPEGRIFVIPALLESCEVPQRLRHIHWVDLFQANGYEKLLRTFRAQGLVAAKKKPAGRFRLPAATFKSRPSASFSGNFAAPVSARNFSYAPTVTGV